VTSDLPPVDGPVGEGGARGDAGAADRGGPIFPPADAAGADAAPGDGPLLDASGDAAAQTDGQKDGPLQADAQRDAAPQQDAQRDAAQQQDTGPQCQTQSLLANGNFDQGPASGWNRYSSWGLAADPVVYPCSSLAHGCQGGSYAAWMGGDNDTDNQIWQTVTVPANTTTLRLKGQSAIDTAETGGVYDQLYIELYLSSGPTFLESLATWSNLNANGGWTAFTLTAASPHAGQTIDLLVEAITDGISVTSFYLDTLVLEAVVCQ
jgi:hypothetical protein